MSWKYNSGYDSCAAKKLLKYRNNSAKRKATMHDRSNSTNTDKCVTLFNTKGNQRNE